MADQRGTRPGSGPPPTPTALRLLRGNPGKRALPQHEYKRVPEITKPPTALSPRAKREWSRLAKDLFEAGLLTKLDNMALAALVSSYARWLEATEALHKTGLLLQSSRGPILNPLLRIVRESQAEYTRMLGEFGLTPAASTRVHAVQADEEDPFESFLSTRERGG